MPTLSRADSDRNLAPRDPAGLEASPADEHVGLYLTDEVFLYRVIPPVGDDAEETVELEDCYRLDVVRVRLAEVSARELRVVKPLPPAAADQ